jgi:hydroxymethylbilane synthase
MTITDSTISGNAVYGSGFGGGIYNAGTLAVTNSIVGTRADFLQIYSYTASFLCLCPQAAHRAAPFAPQGAPARAVSTRHPWTAGAGGDRLGQSFVRMPDSRDDLSLSPERCPPAPAILRIGSRGSQLALWQANHIADQLRANGHSVFIEIIRTTGDAMQNVSFSQVGSKGMFTKEIEEALFEGRIDLAVHSLKDLPTELAPPFTLAAIPPRADARDLFLSALHPSFESLPSGARIGTSSLRRRAQLRRHRSDLEYVEFRGNIDTRLRKLAEGQVEAIILAAAGIDRLHLDVPFRESFEPLQLCPAAGQGALAIETRAADAATIAALAFLDDASTRYAVTAERSALAALGGGCQVPIGIHCFPAAEGYTISSAVASPDGTQLLRIELENQRVSNPAKLGELLAERLLQQGARELLEVNAS